MCLCFHKLKLSLRMTNAHGMSHRLLPQRCVYNMSTVLYMRWGGGAALHSSGSSLAIHELPRLLFPFFTFRIALDACQWGACQAACPSHQADIQLYLREELVSSTFFLRS